MSPLLPQVRRKYFPLNITEKKGALKVAPESPATWYKEEVGLASSQLLEAVSNQSAPNQLTRNLVHIADFFDVIRRGGHALHARNIGIFNGEKDSGRS